MRPPLSPLGGESRSQADLLLAVAVVADDIRGEQRQGAALIKTDHGMVRADLALARLDRLRRHWAGMSDPPA